MVATAEKQQTREKLAKWPSETWLASHTGLNRHGRREWKQEERGVAFLARIGTLTKQAQRLLPSRRANRWLKREKSE